MDGCTKYAHMTCYIGKIVGITGKEPRLDGQLVACTKVHNKSTYEKLNGIEGNEDGRNTWDVDGKNGKDDPHTSMKILLDWWTTQGNYDQYRGKNNNGTKKKAYAEQLAEKMKKETTSTDRNYKQVMSKITNLEAA